MLYMDLDRQALVQRYIANPLLVHGRKFDLRCFCLVARTDPLLCFYHDGYIRCVLYRACVRACKPACMLGANTCAGASFRVLVDGRVYINVCKKLLGRRVLTSVLLRILVLCSIVWFHSRSVSFITIHI